MFTHYYKRIIVIIGYNEREIKNVSRTSSKNYTTGTGFYVFLFCKVPLKQQKPLGNSVLKSNKEGELKRMLGDILCHIHLAEMELLVPDENCQTIGTNWKSMQSTANHIMKQSRKLQGTLQRNKEALPKSVEKVTSSMKIFFNKVQSCTMSLELDFSNEQVCIVIESNGCFGLTSIAEYLYFYSIVCKPSIIEIR